MFTGLESSIKSDFLKIFPVPGSEFISHLRINIIVFRELTELAPRLSSAEYISPYRNPDGVRQVVLRLRVDQVIAVRYAVK